MQKIKLIKKAMAGILTIMIVSSLSFSGCTKTNTTKNNTNNNDSQNQNTASDEEINRVRKEFDEYMNQLFIEEMSESSVSTHFSLENPEDYGIIFSEPTWGEALNTDSIDSMYKEQKAILSKLDTFDTALLTTQQRITYNTVYKYIENSYSVKDLYLFDELFSPINGMQSQIPIIFSEYDFFDKDDIEDYISLMETVDVYLNNLIDYEKYRASEGYFLTDAGADDVIQQCKDFIEPKENCLIAIFSEKLDEFGVTAAEKTDYMNRFSTAITDKLIPAYKNIISTLESLKGSRRTQLGLSEFENGSEYYSSLVRNYTGSDKSVKELIDLVEESISHNISLVYIVMESNPDIYDKYAAFEYPDTEPAETIKMHIDSAGKYFPDIASIPYEVKSVPKSLEEAMSPAFYLVPPIDNKDKNMIYINHSEEYEHMNLYSTLAHEGVPGHMYQSYYYAGTNPAPIRSVFSFGGYCEGWATYAEYYSYKFAGMDSSLQTFSTANDRYNLALYSRIDLGIHYEGWDLDDTIEMLGAYGIYDDELAKDIYNTLIDDPAVYLQYYIGYLEIDALKDKAEDELASFDIVDFHRFILDMGPTFFDVIEDEMDIWIKEENSN